MDSGHGRVRVLMLPWLAHGHISPFLKLAKNLAATQNFDIYICSTPVNISSINHDLLPPHSSLSIHFVEFHLPTSPDLPPHHHTTKGLPPHLMPSLVSAFYNSSSTFSTILKTINPDLLIYDFAPSWVPVLASSMNVHSVFFMCSSAVMFSFIYHFIRDPTVDFPFPDIYLHDHEREKFMSLIESRRGRSQKASSSTVLIKTSRAIEAKYIDYLSVLLETKLVPVGPLIKDPTDNPIEDSDFIKWLDKKERFSTVFVSFGSECFLSKEEIEETAHGLEQSKVNFIWVIRFGAELEKFSMKESLPEGFLERVGERGKVTEGWAPQARILGHPSVCGFASHCGWNSLLESITSGVPIIAMPVQFDQPLNSRLVEELGIGVEVKRDEKGRLYRETVAEVIRAVVVEEGGESVRRRAKELREILRCKGEEEMNGAMEELLQLCKGQKEN
ncbi:hypothetical protein SLA2020_390820 [Shorea laevis]